MFYAQRSINQALEFINCYVKVVRANISGFKLKFEGGKKAVTFASVSS